VSLREGPTHLTVSASTWIDILEFYGRLCQEGEGDRGEREADHPSMKTNVTQIGWVDAVRAELTEREESL
jgi:hypothetical protein